MATVNASMAVGATHVAVASSGGWLASRNSVSFGSGRVPSVAFVRARSVLPLSVRAGEKPDMAPGSQSSTGGITEKAREIAEKTAVIFDGVKEDVESKLTDNGRVLKSKTGDVVYSAHRNAEGVANDVVEKTNEAQTKYTKGK